MPHVNPRFGTGYQGTLNRRLCNRTTMSGIERGFLEEMDKTHGLLPHVGYDSGGVQFHGDEAKSRGRRKINPSDGDDKFEWEWLFGEVEWVYAGGGRWSTNLYRDSKNYKTTQLIRDDTQIKVHPVFFLEFLIYDTT